MQERRVVRLAWRACPFMTYQLLMAYVPAMSKVTGLAIPVAALHEVTNA